MKRRIIVLFILIVLILSGTMLRIYKVATLDELAQAAARQSSYTLTIPCGRGNIYDCNGLPLTNFEDAYIAAVSPCPKALGTLYHALPIDEFKKTQKLITQGRPFLKRLPERAASTNEIQVFEVKDRYGQEYLAPHIIGYLEPGTSKGVLGIEKAYDDWLGEENNNITVTYTVDAMGRQVLGVPPRVQGSYRDVKRGVVLTIDKNIQQICINAAKKYLTSGAIVVMSIPDGQLKAVVSYPDFSPNDINSSLNAENSPFINRAFTQYNIGSIFKIAVAAAALENGVSAQKQISCSGGVQVLDHYFNCHEKAGHGLLDMRDAFSESCNPYFIEIANEIGADKLYNMAQKLGFGRYSELAPAMRTDAGILPSLSTLRYPVALSNFAFGQGDFMATPIQAACMVTAVASSGMLPQPRLVQALVDDNGEVVKEEETTPPVSAMSQRAADKIKEFMINTVLNGTGRLATPKFGGAGGKTATAETGWVKEGKFVKQAWFAGFYPAQNPKYTIVVLAENGDSGSSSCAPVFKEIADAICEQFDLFEIDNAQNE